MFIERRSEKPGVFLSNEYNKDYAMNAIYTFGGSY